MKAVIMAGGKRINSAASNIPTALIGRWDFR